MKYFNTKKCLIGFLVLFVVGSIYGCYLFVGFNKATAKSNKPTVQQDKNTGKYSYINEKGEIIIKDLDKPIDFGKEKFAAFPLADNDIFVFESGDYILTKSFFLFI